MKIVDFLFSPRFNNYKIRSLEGFSLEGPPRMYGLVHSEQESIPVRCVPTAELASSTLGQGSHFF